MSDLKRLQESGAFRAYQARARAAHRVGPWSPGVWKYIAGTTMLVMPCSWISDGLYGEVYWLGMSSNDLIALGAHADAATNWVFQGLPRTWNGGQ